VLWGILVGYFWGYFGVYLVLVVCLSEFFEEASPGGNKAVLGVFGGVVSWVVLLGYFGIWRGILNGGM